MYLGADIARLNAGAAPRVPVAPARPIDRAHLARFTLGDPQIEEEILGLFLAQIASSMAALASAATPRDWMIAAHTLKGASRGVGAIRVGVAAEAAEEIPGPVDTPRGREVMSRLELACGEARAYILEAFPDLAQRP